MNRTRFALLGAALALGAAARAADADRLPEGLAQLREAVLPRAEEQKWKRVPWMTDLAEAVAVAAREKRPVCVWAVDDEPLDRC